MSFIDRLSIRQVILVQQLAFFAILGCCEPKPTGVNPGKTLGRPLEEPLEPGVAKPAPIIRRNLKLDLTTC